MSNPSAPSPKGLGHSESVPNAIAPLRAVLRREFVAYEGTRVTLACRHVLVRKGRAARHRYMRCQECGDSQ